MSKECCKKGDCKKEFCKCATNDNKCKSEIKKDVAPKTDCCVPPAKKGGGHGHCK